ncbi:MAG: hypothetical protein EA339_03975 [Rhodobacteraceae bacterium]|nr:MAG: hypothetical protein EA339_03975 [Paracoccaceae bacterium]
MSTTPYVISALVIVGAACTAGLTTPEKERTDPNALVCELHISNTTRGVTLRAEARSQRAVEGHYELAIDQRSGAGRATIRQGGPFALQAGERATLSQSDLAGRARDLDAELTLRAGGQVKTCRAAAL